MMARIAKSASEVDSDSTKKKKLKGSRLKIGVSYLSPIKMCRGKVLDHPRATVKYSEYLSPGVWSSGWYNCLSFSWKAASVFQSFSGSVRLTGYTCATR